jgi:hypothetical protein
MGEARGVCQDFIECEESVGQIRASGKAFDRNFHHLPKSE